MVDVLSVVLVGFIGVPGVLVLVGSVPIVVTFVVLASSESISANGFGSVHPASKNAITQRPTCTRMSQASQIREPTAIKRCGSTRSTSPRAREPV